MDFLNSGSGNNNNMIIMLVVAAVVFYFFVYKGNKFEFFSSPSFETYQPNQLQNLVRTAHNHNQPIEQSIASINEVPKYAAVPQF